MLFAQEHSCWWMRSSAPPIVAGMQENAQLADEIGAWMRQVMAEKNLTPTTWAEAAKVARTTIARPIKPGYPFVTSSRTLAKLATAAGVAPPDVRAPAEAKVVPLFLPVCFRVQAGHWIEVEYAEQDFPSPDRPVAPDLAYSEWPQWLELVVGDSVDKEILPGSFAHVVDAIEMGYSPVHGDFVVVERRRDGGRFRERSIKQVEITRGNRIELWPRSNNPAWDKPLDLTDGGEGSEVEIVGLVIGSYRGMR